MDSDTFSFFITALGANLLENIKKNEMVKLKAENALRVKLIVKIIEGLIEFVEAQDEKNKRICEPYYNNSDLKWSMIVGIIMNQFRNTVDTNEILQDIVRNQYTWLQNMQQTILEWEAAYINLDTRFETSKSREQRAIDWGRIKANKCKRFEADEDEIVNKLRSQVQVIENTIGVLQSLAETMKKPFRNWPMSLARCDDRTRKGTISEHDLPYLRQYVRHNSVLQTTYSLMYCRDRGGHLVREQGLHKGRRPTIVKDLNGNKRTIYWSDNLDPPEGVCFNCWQGGHDYLFCKVDNFPFIPFCKNCGRSHTTIGSCPRNCKNKK